VSEQVALDESSSVEVADPAAELSEELLDADVEPAGVGEELGDPTRLRAAVEAVLFVVDAPVTVETLSAAFGRPVPEINDAVEQLRVDYAAAGRGIEVRAVADGYRIYTRSDYAFAVEAFLLDGQRSRLSQAGLETLSVIAYRQPVTRGRISAIRGVNVDGVIRTLLTRGLIVEVGADPETGGGLFRTTALFLEKLGLQSLDELPSLAPLLPELESLDTDEL
jgi:segregation and condensation protein B